MEGKATEQEVSVEPTDWHTSTYSGGGNCVEQGRNLGAEMSLVRDTKDVANGEDKVLSFSQQAWTGFIGAVASGEIRRGNL